MAYTDHRRDADAIVVLGARVYADGRPSEALAQRMATACELYRAGYAKKVVLSGGRDPGGARSEPDAMRELALGCGVPRDAIVLDEDGVDTRATGVDVARILGEGARVLAVSHGYHLARVQIALERQGIEAYTVPARERILLPGKPYYVARELVAWAVYLARG
ncbi:MAG: YdcF family protein [Polyangiaceae bacterium]